VYRELRRIREQWLAERAAAHALTPV
jgi:hypothetical protein